MIILLHKDVKKIARTQKTGHFFQGFFCSFINKGKKVHGCKIPSFPKRASKFPVGNTAASPLPLALHIFPGLGIKEKGEG